MTNMLDRALEVLRTIGSFDTDRLEPMLSPDVRYWVAGMPVDFSVDRDGVLAALQQARTEVFDGPIEYTIRGTTTEGNRVAIEATSKAKLRSGADYYNVYHFLFEFSDSGKLVLGREYVDTKLYPS